MEAAAAETEDAATIAAVKEESTVEGVAGEMEDAVTGAAVEEEATVEGAVEEMEDVATGVEEIVGAVEVAEEEEMEEMEVITRVPAATPLRLLFIQVAHQVQATTIKDSLSHSFGQYFWGCYVWLDSWL